jgi:hypothetical protein
VGRVIFDFGLWLSSVVAFRRWDGGVDDEVCRLRAGVRETETRARWSCGGAWIAIEADAQDLLSRAGCYGYARSSKEGRELPWCALVDTLIRQATFGSWSPPRLPVLANGTVPT